MKKIFFFLSIVTFVVCTIFLIFLRMERIAVVDLKQAQQDPTVASLERASSQRLELPLNKSQQIEFSTDETSFADLSTREWGDQYRDWLLFAAVAALESFAEDYSKILYDLPPSRQGYMRPFGNFEFGETRSRFIGGGRVLALVPAGRTASERKDLLAQIADEQRKNLGGPFDRLLVVEYELDGKNARGVLTNRGEIDYAALFSAEYGYSEKVVTKLSDLEEFMRSSADLAIARKIDGGGLLLGGRRLLDRKYRSIGVEEVATVWQAEQQIQRALARANDARWAYRKYRTVFERMELERQQDEDLGRTEAQLAREFPSRKLVNGSGFSLDSEIDFAGLKQALEALLGKIGPRLVPETNANAVISALASKNIVPLRELRGQLAETNYLVAQLLGGIEEAYTYQAARYDGDLQGTEVGMILFYTDLLAKLWIIDFVQTSPKRGIIPDFVDDPSAPTSLIYEAEKRELSSARLWFGHSNLGFQIAEQRNAVFLARGATRIYSAGWDPLKPGIEAETSAFLAASTDWWNDHYEEVARYEQEYERLNQIMKWSVVLGWLNESNQGARLGFLANVPVDHSKVFPSWVSRHPELKFNRWKDINFFPAGYKGTTTEALPRLSGPVTRGGVSLASKDAVKRAPIALNVEKSFLRSNLDYAATTGKNALTTLEGTGFKFAKIDASRMSVAASAKPGAKFRGTTTQLARGDFERTFVIRPDAVRVETRLASNSIGDLEIGRSSNGFRVGWQAREIDRAHGLARELSASEAPDLLLLRDPTVETVVKLSGDASYAVKIRDAKRWIKLAPEDQPSVDIAGGWQLRASVDSAAAKRSMQASLINDSELSSVLGRHVVIETASDGKPLLRAGDGAGAGATRTIEVDLGEGTRLSAWIKPPSEAVHLSAKGGGSINPSLIMGRLGPEDFKAIRVAAANDNAQVFRPTEASRLRALLADGIQNRDFRKAASDIAADPVNGRRALNAQMKSDLERLALLKSKRPNETLRELDSLIAIHGRHPEFTLRRALFEIERGNVQAAVESAKVPTPRPLGNRQAFFDEVNARFVSGSPQAKADLYRYAEYVDWVDRIARSRRGGSVEAIAAGNRFDFNHRLADFSRAKPLSAEEVSGLPAKKIIVYRQDHASLNQLEWTASLDQTLRRVMSGKLGKIYHLGDQDIAHFRPSVIWSPDHATPFKASGAQLHDLSPKGYQSCNDRENCANDNDPDQQQDGVYLVSAN